jgi:hypothetical protein
VVLAAALAGAVTLAARATLEANRATLDVLHGIGATDAQLLGPSDLLLLILLPFAQAALATLVARWTLQRTLAAAL